MAAYGDQPVKSSSYLVRPPLQYLQSLGVGTPGDRVEIFATPQELAENLELLDDGRVSCENY